MEFNIIIAALICEINTAR